MFYYWVIKTTVAFCYTQFRMIEETSLSIFFLLLLFYSFWFHILLWFIHPPLATIVSMECHTYIQREANVSRKDRICNSAHTAPTKVLTIFLCLRNSSFFPVSMKNSVICMCNVQCVDVNSQIFYCLLFYSPNSNVLFSKTEIKYQIYIYSSDFVELIRRSFMSLSPSYNFFSFTKMVKIERYHQNESVLTLFKNFCFFCVFNQNGRRKHHHRCCCTDDGDDDNTVVQRTEWLVITLFHWNNDRISISILLGGVGKINENNERRRKNKTGK